MLWKNGGLCYTRFRNEKIQTTLIGEKKDESFYYRQKKLYDEQLISGEQLEAAKAQNDISFAAHEAIRYQIQQADASLQSTLDNLSKTMVSPKPKAIRKRDYHNWKCRFCQISAVVSPRPSRTLTKLSIFNRQKIL